MSLHPLVSPFVQIELAGNEFFPLFFLVLTEVDKERLKLILGRQKSSSDSSSSLFSLAYS